MLVSDRAGVARILATAKRVAVLGIKTEGHAGAPAFYVPQALQAMGLEIIPVPVYYPDVATILGRTVYRKLVDIPGAIDIVDVFRRPEDIDAHVDDMLAKKPGCVWLQSGIRNDVAAKRLSDAGIDVVQDHCLMVEYRARR